MRCGQPIVGSIKKINRCKEDETLLKVALPFNKKGYIYDLRDVNTMKNAASKGGGYETEANYPLWTRVNRNCERHDQLHASLGKLLEACSNNDNWLSKLESSNWYANVR
jgi:myotubularin-related protein 9